MVVPFSKSSVFIYLNRFLKMDSTTYCKKEFSLNSKYKLRRVLYAGANASFNSSTSSKMRSLRSYEIANLFYPRILTSYPNVLSSWDVGYTWSISIKLEIFSAAFNMRGFWDRVWISFGLSSGWFSFESVTNTSSSSLKKSSESFF